MKKNFFKLPQGLYRTHHTEFAFPGNETGLLQLYNIRPRKFQADEAAILDANGNLFLLNPISQDSKGSEAIIGTIMLLATNVLAVAQTDFEFIFIGCEDGNDHHRIVSISDKIERRSVAANKVKRAFFGRGEMGKKVAAFEDGVGNWTILDEKDNVRIMPRPKGEVVGVYNDPRFAPNAGFFELLDDRQTLEFTWAYGRRKRILKTNEEIVKIEFSPRSPIFAYQIAGGELVLFSLTHRTAIGRYSK